MNVKFKAHLFIFSLFFCYNLSAQEIVKGDLHYKDTTKKWNTEE